MRTERNIERSRGSNDIICNVSPEDVYSFLTKDDKASSYEFKTNWQSVVRPEVDAVLGMDVRARCELKATYLQQAGKEKGPKDSFSKVFWYEADLWVPDRVLEVGFWSTTFLKVQRKLKDLGVKLLFPPYRSSYGKGQWSTSGDMNIRLYHGFGNEGFFITNELKDKSRPATFGMAIGFTNKPKPQVDPLRTPGYDLGLKIVYPWLYTELNVANDVAKVQKDFLVYLRNTKLAITNVDKGTSPDALRIEKTFAEEKEKLIERVKCGYCSSSYDRAPGSLACPNCGGSN